MIIEQRGWRSENRCFLMVLIVMSWNLARDSDASQEQESARYKHLTSISIASNSISVVTGSSSRSVFVAADSLGKVFICNIFKGTIVEEFQIPNRESKEFVIALTIEEDKLLWLTSHGNSGAWSFDTREVVNSFSVGLKHVEQAVINGEGDITMFSSRKVYRRLNNELRRIENDMALAGISVGNRSSGVFVGGDNGEVYLLSSSESELGIVFAPRGDEDYFRMPIESMATNAAGKVIAMVQFSRVGSRVAAISLEERKNRIDLLESSEAEPAYRAIAWSDDSEHLIAVGSSITIWNAKDSWAEKAVIGPKEYGLRANTDGRCSFSSLYALEVDGQQAILVGTWDGKIIYLPLAVGEAPSVDWSRKPEREVP